MSDDFLVEETEKTTTKVFVVKGGGIPRYKYFVKLKDFEREVLAIVFVSFLVLVASFIF